MIDRLKQAGVWFAGILGGIPVGGAFFLVAYGVLELFIPWQTAAWIVLPMAVIVWAVAAWYSVKFLRYRGDEAGSV